MAKQRLKESEVEVFDWSPKTNAQRLAKELWKRSRIMFFLGQSGGGKTHTALALALSEVLKSDTTRLLLSRPQITIGEPMGYLPGSMAEKLEVWFGPLYDVWNSISKGQPWAKLQKRLSDRIETIPIGMMRGRTFKDAILILDEGQNATRPQLKCCLSRIGENGRIIITGDTQQSDRYIEEDSPLEDIASRLDDLDQITSIRFKAEDQMRDPLINEILERI